MQGSSILAAKQVGLGPAYRETVLCMLQVFI